MPVGDFKGGGSLWGYILGWRVTFRANIYGPLVGRMVILQLCRWRFLHKETLYQTLFDWSWILFKPNKKSFFESPFGGLRGNVRTPSMAHWKARGDFLIVITELFRYLLRLRRYKRNSASRRFSKGVGHFQRKCQTVGDVAHQPLLVSEN